MKEPAVCCGKKMQKSSLKNTYICKLCGKFICFEKKSKKKNS